MKLPKELITVTPLSITLSGISFVVLVALAFYLGMEYQMAKQHYALPPRVTYYAHKVLSPKPIVQSTQTIDDVITYETPKGWTKVAGNGQIDLRSPDYTENLYPFITNGAEIRIDEHGRIIDKSLADYVKEDVNGPKGTEDSISTEELNTYHIPIIRKFYCYEGCYDGYYFKTDDTVWRFDIACEPNCGSHEKIMAKYKTVFDKFLQSIRPKDSR